MASSKSLVDQAGQLAGTPMMDPSKNPEAMNMAQQLIQQQPPTDG
jgi:hypothetical protein